MRNRILPLLLLACCPTLFARASSTLPISLNTHFGISAAVFRGTALENESFRDEADGLIYTRTLVRVDEPLKGTFPPAVRLVHRGGTAGDEHEFYGFSPRLEPGNEYLLFVTRRGDGSLFCTQGSPSAMRLLRSDNADRAGTASFVPFHQMLLEQVRALAANEAAAGESVTDQAGESSGFVQAAGDDGTVSAAAVTGMSVDVNGISSRFIQLDRGEPIPYLIDADALPAGISLAQATNAVLQALNAWTAVTSLKFRFEGLQSFGAAADAITAADEKLRIQLHDNYNRITATNVLGIGGWVGNSSKAPGSTWEIGGNVAGNEFRKTVRGYVVLERTNTSMQVLSTFTEVLCHEIGHALSLAHSSENPNEPSAHLREAIMFFQAHKDGRGATLGAYDPPIIQQAYPSNMPPYTFARVMDVTTDPYSQPNVPGINEIELRGYDLQSDPLTVAITGISSGPGAFSLIGNLLKFTPGGYFGSPRVDPSGNSSYALLYMRASDGINASPYATVRVISLNPDQFPMGATDGLPDDWMISHFGNANPAAGANRGANDDFDGDGLTNKEEYIADGVSTGPNAAGTPTDANSAQRILSLLNGTLQFQAKPYELYEVLGSTNLATWTRIAPPFVPTSSPATVANIPTTNAQLFLRVEKVP